MDLREIKEVIKLMKANDITDFELEKDDFKIILRKEKEIVTRQITETPMQAYYSPQPILPPTPQPVAQPVAQPKAPENDPSVDYIVSPMVGTFYLAPSPESPPYVTTGQEVKPDDVVCIVEAMKVFNEIKAEMKGKILEVMAENGAPVEYGQKLFKIKK